MVFSQIESLFNIYTEISDSLEFMREYQGNRIQLRESDLSKTEMTSSGVRRVDIVIEGEVEKVIATPPGFVLTDVTKYVDRSPKMKDENWRVPDGSKESIERKFVSFNSIQEIDFIED